VNDALIGYLTQGGSGAALLLVVIYILRGLLVPSSTLKQLREETDKRVADALRVAGIWEKAFNRLEARGDKQEEALRECLEVGKASLAILQAVRSASQGYAELPPGRNDEAV
jgi:hypothetical protein